MTKKKPKKEREKTVTIGFKAEESLQNKFIQMAADETLRQSRKVNPSELYRQALAEFKVYD